MKVSLKSPDLEALRSTVYGVLWTKHGLQIVRPGDYIVRAATGCTYRLKEDTVHEYYNIRGNPDNIKEFAEKLARANNDKGFHEGAPHPSWKLEHAKDCACIKHPGTMCNCGAYRD